MMKLTFVFVVAACLQVHAKGYGQKITIAEKNASIEKVLANIRKQSGYEFLYNTNVLKNLKKIDILLSRASVEEALSECLKGSNLSYTIVGKTIVIKPEEKENNNQYQAAPPPNIDVHGKVLDEKDNALSGVSVEVKGTKTGTQTDESGLFTLTNVDPNAVLVFSHVNMISTEEKLNGRSTLFIKLNFRNVEMDSVSLVVNTGYQSLPKERSAGSFAKPDMAIIANRTGSMNILQRLDGLVPGLTINNSPGATQNPFLIRGLTTVGLQIGGLEAYGGTSRSPLYVVDGIPLEDVSSINPQDVADITVLKDATAASIWGARAANGVIVIVTKKGTRDGKLKIVYDAFVNFQGKPDINYFPVLNSQQFIQSAKEIFDPVLNPWATVSAYTPGSSGVPPHEMILYNQYRNIITAAQANKSLDSLGAIDNRQQIKDLWYRNAMLMNHTISISGGEKMYSFYGSAAYTDNQSNRPGEKNDNYKINLRQDFTLGKRVRFNLITDLTNTVSNTKRNIDVDDRFYPYQLFQDAGGNNLSIPYMTALTDSTRIDYQTRSRISLDYNPLNEVNNGYTKSDALLSRNILGVNVKLFDGLTFEGTYGYIRNTNKTQTYDDVKSYKGRSELVQFTVAPTTASTPVYYLPVNGGTLAITNLNQRNWTVRNQLIYNKVWKNALHQLTALAGQEAQDQFGITNTSRARGYNDLLQTYGVLDYFTLNSTGVVGVVMANTAGGRSLLNDGYFGQSETQTRFTSYYSNLAYTYNRKYSVNGSYRIDQSNLFGLDKSAQNKPAWSLGGKWLMSEESFLKDVSWLNSFAIRTTYGIAGVAPAPGTAASYDVLSSSNSIFLPGGTGLQIATPSNLKLTWESTRTLNIGFDFAVMKNRLNGSVDLYQKKTSDLLGNVPTNGFSGYATIVGNLGDLENKGIELSLNSINIRNKNFCWNTLFNIAYNKNELTSFNAKALATTTGNGRVKEQYVTGYAAYAVFAYQFAGLDNLGDPQIMLADGTVSKALNISKPGDIKYMGTSQPVWSGGFSNIINYKNFGLSINTILNLGHVMRKDVNGFYSGGRFTHFNLATGFTSGNVHADFVNRWKQPGDELITNVPSYTANTTTSLTRRDINYYSLADINVVSASYIKLRDITLSYSLPRTLLARIKTDQISFRAQVSNLMLWKANKDDIDPEYQFATGGGRALIANQGTITFGVNVKF